VTENYLLPLMDLVGCSSVLKSVEDLYGLDCRIKWPNDILINEKVFSSVKSDLGGKGSGIILSLNINVNMDEEMSDIKISSIKSEKDEDVENIFNYTKLIYYKVKYSSKEGLNRI
jgi:biotin-(acetyl-CoA carboxylase) ligase